MDKALDYSVSCPVLFQPVSHWLQVSPWEGLAWIMCKSTVPSAGEFHNAGDPDNCISTSSKGYTKNVEI